MHPGLRRNYRTPPSMLLECQLGKLRGRDFLVYWANGDKPAAIRPAFRNSPHEQSLGWNPDLNDGVRMNSRPFMTAGVPRMNPIINDRGREPKRDKGDFPWFWKDGTFIGDRVNEVHLTDAEIRSAPETSGDATPGNPFTDRTMA